MILYKSIEKQHFSPQKGDFFEIFCFDGIFMLKLQNNQLIIHSYIMNKEIRSKVVKESLLDYETLANSLKENTESAVKNLLSETVRETYAKLLSEDDDKEYDEEEVEDTDSTVSDDAVDAVDSSSDEGQDSESMELDADAASEGGDEGEEGEELSLDVASDEGEGAAEGDEDEWAEFDKYKTADGEYDFSEAEDEDIVKVYKLMKDEDQVLVRKDGDNVNITDNETGAEYLVSLGDNSNAIEDEFGVTENEFDNMNESNEKLYELVLEYDSNVGYTDNYQKKDAMTTPSMEEPGKNVNDWDAGVPKGKEKPFSKYQAHKKTADKPFNAGEGKKVEEDVDLEEGAINELKTNAEHSANVGSTSRTDGPNNPRARKGRSFHTAQNGQETGTADNPYKGGEGKVEENLMKRVNKALKENKELKSTLTNVIQSLKEAAVTNHNLAQIIRLISENSTTQDEKKEIIKRFTNEAKTIELSKNLYESISNDLKKAKKINISEEKGLVAEGTEKINETTIYQSKDMLDSLDLMHRMMK